MPLRTMNVHSGQRPAGWITGEEILRGVAVSNSDASDPARRSHDVCGLGRPDENPLRPRKRRRRGRGLPPA